MFANIFRKHHNGYTNDYGAGRFRIGTSVYNRRFGQGVVQAIKPDGNLVVRFDQKKSRSIFPTMLERTN